MSLWKSLFGSRSAKPAASAAPVEYNGFTIRPEPYLDDGQYQTAGVIEKEIAGVMKSHRFIRADRHPGFDDAVTFTIAKAKQIIDLQGERLLQ